MFFKVSHLKGINWFGKKGKLKPRYIRPFEVLQQFGTVVYYITIPPKLSHVHDVFHVSMLQKYVHESMHVINYYPLTVREDLSYVKKLIEILDCRDQVLRNKAVPLVWVLWKNHMWEESTWEREDKIQEHYPFLFEWWLVLSLGTKLIKGEWCNTPNPLIVLIYVLILITIILGPKWPIKS